MCEVKVKVINKSVHRLPEYKTSMSAGMDLKANITDVWKLNPGERKIENAAERSHQTRLSDAGHALD